MNESFDRFLDLLTARVPAWDVDYRTCRDLLSTALPSPNEQAVDAVMSDFMHILENAMVDQVGFENYCHRFVRRSDTSASVILPENLRQRYERSEAYEKMQLFWAANAPKRYLFHLLTTLFGEIFGGDTAGGVFAPLWRSFVKNLKEGGKTAVATVPQSQIAVLGSSNGLPDRWNETIISQDLRHLSGNTSALGHYLEKIRERFIIRQDVKTLRERTQWLEARLAELKIAEQIQATVFNMATARTEHALRAKQLAFEHANADTDLGDAHRVQPLRTENRTLTLQAENAKLRRLIRDSEPEPAKAASLSPEQQRAKERADCEAKIQSLKDQKQAALKLTDEDERIQRVNAIDNAIQREYDRWSKLL